MDIIRHTVEIIDGVHHIRTFRKCVVHTEDSNSHLYSSRKLEKGTLWNTEPAAKFVAQHSTIPIMHEVFFDNARDIEVHVYVAELEEKKLSEYYLKWGNNGDR